MQSNSRAPLLSATLRTDSCWIMSASLLQNFGHAPANLLRDRARLDDAHAVADAAALVVVDLEAAGVTDDLLVEGVRLDAPAPRTITVFSILSLTTTPSRTLRRGADGDSGVASVIDILLIVGGIGDLLLGLGDSTTGTAAGTTAGTCRRGSAFAFGFGLGLAAFAGAGAAAAAASSSSGRRPRSISIFTVIVRAIS